MHVTIRLRPDIALALQHQQPLTVESEELVKAAKELGVTLEPIHPGVEDAELIRYFAVEVPSLPFAERVIKRLRQCVAIDSAYVKPPDELP